MSTLMHLDLGDFFFKATRCFKESCPKKLLVTFATDEKLEQGVLKLLSLGAFPNCIIYLLALLKGEKMSS